uniref:Protein kinase domain-containing protein n=1 Tax=Wuchereria bancrofti TaxID=6293 RepID=A0A1I8EG35_WUCBA
MKFGSGAFCNVYKGAIKGLAPICKINPSLLSTGTFKDCMCAVKMLPSIADDIAHADFIQEIKFMKSLKYHPHLISMLGISIDNNGNIMLLTEYCDLGDLLHLVRNRKGEIIMNHTNEHSKLRIKDLVSFAWQISNGLEYLSSIGCVHRDVAARNIFVNATNICKIADFGLCRLSDSFIYSGRSGRLPLKWMAPESLRSYEYSIKTDVWSYGILLYEIFSFGEVPYALLQTTEILDFLNSGARLSQPQYCPANIYTLMLQCWQDESSLRPNFTEICAILRIASRMSQNLQSITTFHKQLSNDYYNKEQEQTVKSDNNLQLISNTDNQLWPSHKTIPENTKEEGQWYYDRNYLDYNPEDSRIESASRLVHELPNDLNDTVTHISQITNDSILHSVAGAIKGLAPICKINPSLLSTGTFKDCMCAVKMLPSIADDIAHADFIQEIKFMKSLKYHPHLISMLGISIDNNGNIMLLTEYCDLGDLLHLVRNRKGEIIMNHTNEHSKLRIKDLVSFAWQISNGLEYLSSIGCVHRDVAARNIFVNATNICKIADFGLCRLSDSFIYSGRSGRLPLKWMAPESLRSYEYSIKTDVYTLMLQCWQDESSLRPNFTEICAILRRQNANYTVNQQ